MKLDALGIAPSPAEELEVGAEDWEDVDYSEGEGDDSDVEMT